MIITLKSLHLENFMMYANKTVDFTSATKILGRNGQGKSSIVNAYMWLLFNCDYDLKDNPNIRRKYKGLPIDTDVSVKGVFDIDGKEVVFKKVQRRSYSGTTYKDDNSYFVNDVPKTLKDYNAYLGIDIATLKMCSNINAFLGKKADEMRTYLFSLVEDMTDYSVAETSEKLSDLLPLLAEYSLEEVETMNKATKTKVTKELPIIDGQIIEKERDIEIKKSIGVAELELQKNIVKEKIANIKEPDTSAIMELKFEIAEYERKANEGVEEQFRSLNRQARQIDNELKTMEFDLEANKQLLARCENKYSVLEIERKKLLDKHQSIKVASLTSERLICPTCKREFDEEHKEIILKDYEKTKAESLKTIVEQGKEVTKERDKVFEQIKSCEEFILKTNLGIVDKKKTLEELETQIKAIEPRKDFSTDNVYLELKNKLNKAENNVEMALQTDDKQKLLAELLEIENKIAYSNTEADENRLDELRKTRLDMEQAKADSERILYIVDELNKSKNTLLSTKINSYFSVVNWELFELAKNGTYKNACIPTINGLSILDISSNKANKIIGKMDICMSIQKLSNIFCPIFIDDAECLDKENQARICESANSQIVLLEVAESDLAIKEGV